ncbi:argininosuccinate lyase [Podochytrium sp. JEL0797]|nr:argininosuccinate lyase [Podochytrium sp. JEL0797]
MSLWGGRFTGAVDPLMHKFNQSFLFDQRMWHADCTASMTYARALAMSGVITSEECNTLVDGLTAVCKEWEAGKFEAKDSDEDIHTANERRLGELVGAVAGKLHTGRSRNDQVATDMRLWLRTESEKISEMLKALIACAVGRAEAEMDVLMPGYTHLQRAQPIRWSHFLLAHAWSWHADHERLLQLTTRFNQLPLGSGALAGNPFNIDREFMAQDLGFTSGIMPNSLYGVSDRDFVAEFMTWASLCMVHLSRVSEDLIVYSSGEFGFVQLADAYSTGSSLMPQKKNPDSLELIRGKSGRIFGNMSGFMMTLKGLPSTYNKDLQEDKEPLFDTVDNIAGCLQIMTGVISTLTVNAAKMKQALSVDMLATDIAEYLVRKKVPFRETHHIAGRAIKMAEDRKVAVSQLTHADFLTLHPAFGKDIELLWDFERSVETRNAAGGTSKSSVVVQIQQLKAYLASFAYFGVFALTTEARGVRASPALIISQIIILESPRMGKHFDALEQHHRDFITNQHIYFLATASLSPHSRINVSPKGHESLRVIANRAFHLDLTGSAAETVAHVTENGRITVMMCAFEGAPNILRLWCKARVVLPNDQPEFASLMQDLYPSWIDQKGVRSIIVMDILKVGTSCGYAVPYFDFVKPRETLVNWASKKSDDEIVAYWAEKNALSIDGVPNLGTPGFQAVVGRKKWIPSLGQIGAYSAMLVIGIAIGMKLSKH